MYLFVTKFRNGMPYRSHLFTVEFMAIECELYCECVNFEALQSLWSIFARWKNNTDRIGLVEIRTMHFWMHECTIAIYIPQLHSLFYSKRIPFSAFCLWLLRFHKFDLIAFLLHTHTHPKTLVLCLVHLQKAFTINFHLIKIRLPFNFTLWLLVLVMMDITDVWLISNQ